MFTSKYYDKPVDAVKAHLTSEQINIVEDIAFVPFDNNNGLYFGLTNESVLFCGEMLTKSNQFFFSGSYSLLPQDSLSDYSKDAGICFTELTLYNENGVSTKKAQYALFFESPYSLIKNNEHKIFEIEETKNYKQFWIVYDIF